MRARRRRCDLPPLSLSPSRACDNVHPCVRCAAASSLLQRLRERIPSDGFRERNDVWIDPRTIVRRRRLYGSRAVNQPVWCWWIIHPVRFLCKKQRDVCIGRCASEFGEVRLFCEACVRVIVDSRGLSREICTSVYARGGRGFFGGAFETSSHG